MKKRLMILCLIASMAVTGMTGCGNKNNLEDEAEISVEENENEDTEKVDKADATESENSKDDSEKKETIKDVIKDAIAENAKDENVTEAKTDYSDFFETYRTTLDIWCEACESNFQAGAAEVTGLMEASMGLESPEDIYDRVGYTLYDLNKDGIPELLMTSAGIEEEGHYASDIYAAYGIDEDNEVRPILEGWARNRYSVMNNGQLSYTGSGGAAYSYMAIYSIDSKRASLKVEDYYFTSPKDEDTIGLYHNYTGVDSIEASDDVTDNGDAFDTLWYDCEHRVISLAVVPLREYKDSSNIEVREQLYVSGKIAQNGGVGSFGKDKFMCVDNASSYIDLFATEDVSEIKVYKISIKDFTEEGKMIYDSEELYSQDKLSIDKPLMIGVTFMGDMPEYAISYKTKNGNEYKYAFYLSGYDGSVVMEKID